MSGKAKKILNFLILRSAMTSRNLTSLALVGLFFGVYVAAGGRISKTPIMRSSSTTLGGAITPPTSEENRTESPKVGRDASLGTELPVEEEVAGSSGGRNRHVKTAKTKHAADVPQAAAPEAPTMDEQDGDSSGSGDSVFGDLNERLHKVRPSRR